MMRRTGYISIVSIGDQYRVSLTAACYSVYSATQWDFICLLVYMVFPFSVVKGDDDSGRRRLMFSSDRKTRQETARCSVAF